MGGFSGCRNAMPNLCTFLNFARSSVPHASEAGERIDAFFSFIYFGPIILFCIGGGLSLIFDDRPHTPDVLQWRAAVVVVIVGCLIAGVINVASPMRRNCKRSGTPASRLAFLLSG
jgi:hypothetical protein